MSRTSFDPKVSKVSHVNVEKKDGENGKGVDKSSDSNYSSVSGNNWKKMTESYSSPSIIDEMINSANPEYYEPNKREIEQSYLGSFMCGDDGNIITATNEDIRVLDHETIEIPSAEELCGLSKVNIYPILQRYQVLKKTLSDLIEQSTSSLIHGGLTNSESEGIKDYIKYLHSCMEKVQKEYDIANYYWLNELNDREIARKEAEENKQWW